MKPPRDDIAAPPFPPTASWVDGAEREMARLTSTGPVLVHFFDFAQLNAVRTLPYIRAWHERYGAHGLTVFGVHTPRYPLSEDPAAVAGATKRLEISYPVICDEQRSLWADYGCRGWPSLFLWSLGGALRWYQFGEGEYRATEEAIQAELTAEGMPDPLPPLRPADAPGAMVIAPTPELLPGGSEQRPWRASAEQPALEVPFEAAGAAAALDGTGSVEVNLDGEQLPPLAVDHPGLYELLADQSHGEHSLTLRPGPEVLVYSIGFAAGVP